MRLTRVWALQKFAGDFLYLTFLSYENGHFAVGGHYGFLILLWAMRKRIQ